MGASDHLQSFHPSEKNLDPLLLIHVQNNNPPPTKHHHHQEAYEKLTDEELRAKTEEFKRRVREGKEDVNGPLLEEAFAVVREAAWRVLQLRHYDVQLMGGMALNEGRLAEMVRCALGWCSSWVGCPGSE